MARTDQGLRERKKRRTRQAIADAAMRLFLQHGFDNVTVAQIARAADVSEQTVFNHFPTKERLVSGHGEERRAAIAEGLRNLPPGASVVEPFRRATAAYLDGIERDPVEVSVAPFRLVLGSPTLWNRLAESWESESAELAAALAERTGEPPDAVAWIVAHALAWTHRAIFRSATRRLHEGEDPHQVAAGLRRDAERAYDLLEHGLTAYGRR
jgi:AcrR family transcriptional regulator